MTEALLAMVPVYGLWLVAGSLVLSCLAVPVPSSILVLTAGGFAAAGDLAFGAVLLTAIVAFIIGDQLAYWLARRGGTVIVSRIRTHERPEKVLRRAEDLMARRGGAAVLISRTILSPLAPYVALLSGSLGQSWQSFTVYAVLGALCWSTAYAGLGYLFANQISAVASTLSTVILFIMALAVMAVLVAHLMRSYRAHQAALLTDGPGGTA